MKARAGRVMSCHSSAAAPHVERGSVCKNCNCAHTGGAVLTGIPCEDRARVAGILHSTARARKRCRAATNLELRAMSLTWGTLYLASEWVIRLVMLFYVPQRRSAAAARAWLLLIFCLPWVGLILYAVFGRA